MLTGFAAIVRLFYPKIHATFSGTLTEHGFPRILFQRYSKIRGTGTLRVVTT
jgi:hypothetical protein